MFIDKCETIKLLSFGEENNVKKGKRFNVFLTQKLKI